ncbi:hypothetical protein CONCODRAFT_13634 [Conidiobolus coronatus NRRL 28638]|uniref:Cytochrome c domain-containing protein n=1 Tax=Conidiobolus coronatus (strain ATCC 28846 / CBS 209.66 / NRRL 28638) TaxID=796925 RepID=A0A137NQG8_CONC2|nr:hypothetical protein CONCODRAFT_13634 [Conidiobolus coronatus NRRL 28638]|eukprot:KXN64958.1 hypothetical protein CONCODRAFT_13634 [Conidiobolus coronatus NRRL 28638]
MTKFNLLPIELLFAALIFAAPITNEADSVMINSHGTIINETGDNSTNNQNGFNEDSFDEANVGLRGGFVGGGAVPIPLQGAAPVPVALPGRPGFVAVPAQGPAFVAVPSGGGCSTCHGRGGRGGRGTQKATTGALNGQTGLLNDAIAVNKLPLDIKLHGDVREEAAAKATVVEKEEIGH